MSFPGRGRLIQALDDAVVGANVTLITDQVRACLCQLIRSDDIRLPANVFETIDAHYARRQLYHSAQFGYSVLAMTWPALFTSLSTAPAQSHAPRGSRSVRVLNIEQDYACAPFGRDSHVGRTLEPARYEA